jgi:uncharacterized protein YcaQ
VRTLPHATGARTIESCGLHDDRLVGKVDAIADRKASILRVHAIHEDVRFTRTMAKAIQAELDDLAAWLGLDAVEHA